MKWNSWILFGFFSLSKVVRSFTWTQTATGWWWPRYLNGPASFFLERPNKIQGITAYWAYARFGYRPRAKWRVLTVNSGSESQTEGTDLSNSVGSFEFIPPLCLLFLNYDTSRLHGFQRGAQMCQKRWKKKLQIWELLKPEDRHPRQNEHLWDVCSHSTNLGWLWIY